MGTTHPSRLTPQWRHHWVLTYPSLRSRRRTEITLISSPPVIHPVATDSCIGRAKSKFRPLNPSRSCSASEGLPERVLREEALNQLMLKTLFSYLADTSLVWLCLMDRDLQSLLFGHTPRSSSLQSHRIFHTTEHLSPAVLVQSLLIQIKVKREALGNERSESKSAR